MSTHTIRCANVNHDPGTIIGTVTLPDDADDYTIALATNSGICNTCRTRWLAALVEDPTIAPELA